MKIIILLVFMLTASLACSEEIKDHLKLSSTLGKVPLIVQVIVPQGFIRGAKTQFKTFQLRQCVYWFNWEKVSKVDSRSC